MYGNPVFSLAVHQPPAAVGQPDPPRGRRGPLQPPPQAQTPRPIQEPDTRDRGGSIRRGVQPQGDVSGYRSAKKRKSTFNL